MTKHLLFSISLFLIFSTILAQVPDWTWVNVVDGNSDDRAWCVATDKDGNSAMGGRFWSDTLSIGDSTHIPVGDSDIFIVKYDSTGNILWSRSFGGTNIDWVVDMFFDQNNVMYITGFFMSHSITFDSFSLINSNQSGNTREGFIAKIDVDGNVIYAESFGGTYDENCQSIIADELGNFYVYGYFRSDEFNIQDTTLQLSGPFYDEDVFLAKYNANHDLEWIKQGKGNEYALAQDMFFCTEGNICINGYFSDYLIFDTCQLSASYNKAAFFIKFDNTGNLLLAKKIRDYAEYGGSWSNMCTDNEGNIYEAGVFYSCSYFIHGEDTLQHLGSGDTYICKFDSNLNPLWISGIADNYSDKCSGVVCDILGNAYVSGTCQDGPVNGDTLFFSDTIYVIIPHIGMYIAKYSPDGIAEWAKTNSAVGYQMVESEGIAIGNDGSLFVTTWHTGTQVVFGSQTYYTSGLMDACLIKLKQDINGIHTRIISTDNCSGQLRVSIKVINLFDAVESNVQILYDTLMMTFTGYENFSQNIQADSINITDSIGNINIYWECDAPVSFSSDTLIELIFNANPLFNDTSTNIELIDSVSYYADSSGYLLPAIFLNGFVNLLPTPDEAVFCMGTDSLCQGSNSVSYGIQSISGADAYIWRLIPETAGEILGIDTIVHVNFFPSFFGTAQLTVNGINDCGVGDTAVYPIMVIGNPISNAGESSIICENSTHTLNGSAINYSVSVWITSGDGTFDDPFKLDAIYTPGPGDIAAGDVYLVLYSFALPPCIYADSDSLLLTINQLPFKPQTPIGPTFIILDTNTWSEYYTFTVANANAYQWFLIPPMVGSINATDTNAIVYWNKTYRSPSANIYVESVNNCGTTSSDSLLINLIPVFLSEHKLSEKIIVAPIPSEGKFKVFIPDIENEFSLKLVNLQGKILSQNISTKTHSVSEFEFDLSNHAAGIYYLIYLSPERSITKKLIIK